MPLYLDEIWLKWDSFDRAQQVLSQFRSMATEHEQWVIALFDGMSQRSKQQVVELLGEVKRYISRATSD